MKLWSAKQDESLGHFSSYISLQNRVSPISRQMNFISVGITGLEKAKIFDLAVFPHL